MGLLGSGRLTEKRQSLYRPEKPRGASQKRIFLLVGTRSCGGIHGCKRSAKTDTLNKDIPAGKVCGKLSKSFGFILLQTNKPFLMPPGALTLLAASPLFGS